MRLHAAHIALLLALGGWSAALMATRTEAQPVPPIVVSAEGPFATVGAAVSQAPPGAKIVVRQGTYREPTIVINKPLTLVGQRGAVLDGEGQRELIRIAADSVTVRGLVFRNVGTSFMEDRAAIKVEKSQGCVIANNRIENAFFGIYLARSSGCRILSNTLIAQGKRESFSGNGIHLWYSTGIEIANNMVRGHRDGIYFEFVEDSRVHDNVSEGNLRYGLHFMYSDRCRYESNTFRDNGAGVAVMYTRSVEMVGNRFEHNWGSAAYGLLLKDIYDSTVTGNVFWKNTIGLYSENSSRIAITNNAFVENGWGVKVMANSIDNRFTGNNFVGNSFDVTTNSQQVNSTFAGNYWDAYEGYDLNHDGTGDVPFRPVRLFAFLVERNEPALLLLHSPLVHLLDAAERVMPVLTPEALVDERPAMRRIAQ